MEENGSVTKSDLIAKIQRETGLSSRNKAEDAYKAIVGGIMSAMTDGETVNLTDFGTFKKIATAERQGRNPQTGEQITIPAGFRIKFKPARKLKDLLNQPEDLPADE